MGRRLCGRRARCSCADGVRRLRGRSDRPRRGTLRRGGRRESTPRQARVCPGFVDTPRALRSSRLAPAHHGHRTDRTTRPAVPRHQRAARGHARRQRSALRPAGPARRGRRHPAAGDVHVAEMLRNGVTTFMEFGSQLRVQEALPARGRAARPARVSRRGLRLRPVGGRRADGPLSAALDRRRGAASSRPRSRSSAASTAPPAAGCAASSPRGRSRRARSSCSRATRQAAGELRMPILTHAAYSVVEFYQIVAEHDDPIELLESLGFLGHDVTIGHGNLIAENGCWASPAGETSRSWAERRDRVACPINIARAGARWTRGRATARPASTWPSAATRIHAIRS